MSVSGKNVTNTATATESDAATENTPAVIVRGLRRVFGDRAVLDGIDLTLCAGDFIALLGPSGTGKTTLLRTLGGLDTADEGTVVVPRARSIVFQEPRLVPAMKVWRNVVLGASSVRAAKAQAIASLAEVGIEKHANAWPRTLSGGEAQRVALARALATEPGLLLLDEPFAALDALTRIRMHDLLAALCERHRPAVVLVTHDVDEAILLADRVLVLANGGIRLDLPVDIEKPRRQSDLRFLKLRERLLEQLGVATGADIHPVEVQPANQS